MAAGEGGNRSRQCSGDCTHGEQLPAACFCCMGGSGTSTPSPGTADDMLRRAGSAASRAGDLPPPPARA